LILLIWILCGICSVPIARSRGRRTPGWGIVGFLLGPIGVALAYMMPPVQEELELDALASGEMKKCPECAELVRREATKCRFCGAELPVRPTPPRPRKFNLN
jgi:hypothetical protein